MALLRGFKCEECNFFTPYESVICPKCGSSKVVPVESLGAGEVYTFTTIHVPPEGFEDKVPYTVVVVKLDEGTLVSASWGGETKPQIGQRVAFQEIAGSSFVFK